MKEVLATYCECDQSSEDKAWEVSVVIKRELFPLTEVLATCYEHDQSGNDEG